MCDINNDAYEFKFRDLTSQMAKDECGKPLNNDSSEYSRHEFQMQVIFRWTSNNEMKILNKKFNLTNSFRYLSFFYHTIFLNFWDINGFDVDIIDEKYLYTPMRNSFISSIIIAGSRLDFYHKKTRINSCQDFIDLNITRIKSIFQIKLDKKYSRQTFEFRNVSSCIPKCSHTNCISL